jgi:hypothetical protein
MSGDSTRLNEPSQEREELRKVSMRVAPATATRVTRLLTAYALAHVVYLMEPTGRVPQFSSSCKVSATNGPFRIDFSTATPLEG